MHIGIVMDSGKNLKINLFSLCTIPFTYKYISNNLIIQVFLFEKDEKGKKEEKYVIF